MEFIRLTSLEHQMYQKAMELYKMSFPYHEQRLESSQHDILNCQEYHFDLIYDEGSFIGLLLYWETQDFIYVEHFCIDPSMRNKCYGQKSLELLKEKQKCIILEIDPPVDELSARRKNFYERVGFLENGYHHVHPPYHSDKDGHLLMVMSFPDKLSQEDYNNFNLYLRHQVMGLKADES